MARLPRFCPSGIAQHIIQRGNNRQLCFASNEDFAAYAHWLTVYSNKFDVDVHAWVFMTNHVHLLVTPSSNDGVSNFMQALGRHYVRYFNKAYRRSGTLWEGRFRSCLVQSEDYLLQCYRYIELNPVRANMVDDPAHYVWSSYQCNGLGKESQLCSPHSQYLSLSSDKKERCEYYRALFSAHVENKLIDDIRESVNSGLALGNDRFKQEVECLYARRVTKGSPGRPKYLSDPN
ncbi:transposase [Eionea flava]